MTQTRNSILPRSTPEAQGVSSVALLSLIDRLERTGLEPHSLMVLRHGQVIAEGWWEPYHRDGVQLLYSLSKSFTGAAVGVAVDEGHLSLDDNLATLFPEQAEGAGSRARSLTLHRALSMSTGHRVDTLPSSPEKDPVAAFFTCEPEEEPGTWFVYNNGATFIAGAAVQLLTGQRLLDYLRPRLFDPLGIETAKWQRDTQGRDLAYSGLHLTTEAIARFGQLLLADGVWNGQRLLPEGWVATASSALTDNSMNDSTIDWRLGYGYQFWQCQHQSYRGDGAYGQYCIVMPEQDAVLVLTSAHQGMQLALDAVWEELLPAFGDSEMPNDAEHLGQLTARLDAARIKPVTGTHAPPSAAGSTFVHQPTPEHPTLRSVTVRATADGVELVIDDGELFVVPCVDGGWPAERTPYVASGGWIGPGVFEARIVAVETPHHLLVTCHGNSVEARWNQVPLHIRSLADLAAPLS
jgi:CubicO group peptidase (beta-lactamase class C family)